MSIKNDEVWVAISETRSKDPDFNNIVFGQLTVCIAEEAFEELHSG